MSGHATFSGTSYQARVIAYVYVHILAQARLGWLELFDDTPIGALPICCRFSSPMSSVSQR